MNRQEGRVGRFRRNAQRREFAACGVVTKSIKSLALRFCGVSSGKRKEIFLRRRGFLVRFGRKKDGGEKQKYERQAARSFHGPRILALGRKNRAAKEFLFLFFFVFFLEDGGGGDGIVAIEFEQANALRGAARFANFIGVDADDFSVFGDDHDVGLFGDLKSGDDGAVAVGGLHVEYAFAAARRDAVFGKRGALSVAFF